MILILPGASPVTNPLFEIFAILLFEDDHGFIEDEVPDPIIPELVPKQIVDAPAMPIGASTFIIPLLVQPKLFL